MAPLQTYLNEESDDGSFIVHATPQDTRRASIESNSSQCDDMGAFYSLDSYHSRMSDFGRMESIQEKSIEMTLTNPKLSSPSAYGMDVFGQDFDSIDVWSEEEIFKAPRKSQRSTRGHSPSR